MINLQINKNAPKMLLNKKCSGITDSLEKGLFYR